MTTIKKEIRHFHLFCGIGGGAKGFNAGEARVGNTEAAFRCLGGVDVDAAAIKDFDSIVGVKGTVMDMFSREQYIEFHDKLPSSNWKEATPQDIQRAAGNEHPHIVFLSAPCKGFSGLLSETKSKTNKYQALNQLTLRGLWLALEAFADDPVEMFVFENVPRIQTRGRHLLDQITGLLHQYGYAVAETTHDCGELGGLAQSRKRFLLVARHIEKVPPFLYEPVKKSLVSVGSLLNRAPMPGDLSAGPMHRLPSLQWKTWVRLAFVEAGSDWRSLNKLAIEDGVLRDYLLVPESHNGFLGVNEWEKHSGAIPGASRPGNGMFSVSDPRFDQSRKWHDGQAYGVIDFTENMGAVSGQSKPGGGTYSVADPRMPKKANRQNGMYKVVNFDRSAGSVTGAAHVAGAAQSVADPRTHGNNTHKNVYRVTPWSKHAGVVTSGHSPSSGGLCVSDPRPNWEGRYGNLAVMNWHRHTNTVISGGKGVQGGYMSVADPRTNMNRKKGDNYLTGRHYGVVPFDAHTGAVSASANLDNGPWSVADPRLPAANEKVIVVIRALDNTWHRPFTTFELGIIQSLIDPEEYLELCGLSDQAWRERLGNMVPPKAGKAIAGVMGTTLLLAWAGETFTLSSQPIWVQPVAIALSVAQGGAA